MDISIVVPAYNEEKNVILLYKKLKEVLEKLNKSYEIIFVDDGSVDNTFENISKIHNSDKKVQIIKFRKNFGKAAALSAAFKKIKGDIIFTIDADLQDDPSEIPKFLEKMDKGYDVVSGWKYPRHDPITKTIPSKIFNWLTSKVTKVRIHDFNCGFKAYKIEVVKDMNVYGGLYRYLPVLAFWKGFRIGEVKVTHHPRKYGRSKYSFGRLFGGFFDLITIKFLITYTKKPLHFFGGLGVLFGGAGFLISLYLLYIKILGSSIGNRPILMLAVLLIVLGVQFVSLGLLGEMITRMNKGKII